MNNSFLLPFSCLLVLLVLFSCEKDDPASTITETAVVTGYLYAGQPCDSILITQAISYNNTDTTALPLSELDVTISDGINSYNLSYQGNSAYGNPSLIIESGLIYTLQFTYREELVSATTFVPFKKEATTSDTLIEMERIEIGGGFPPAGGGTPGEDAIEINWDNTEGDYYYVVVQNLEDEPDYINEFLAAQDTLSDRFQNFRFISEPQISNYYNIDPNREVRQFGQHRVIVFRVNPEYAALYNISDASSLSITEPPSNVENGLGLLTGVASDTLYFWVEEE